MQRAIIAIAALTAAVCVCPARADFQDGRIITVDDDGPADFTTIQAAINDANDGDTIIVADGIYTGDGNRDIDFLGKAITLTSENGPQTCIIDCNGTEAEPHRGFIFQNGEAQDTVLSGFTIKNGYVTGKAGVYHSGGGIWCTKYSGPTIANCIICENTAHYGGGIATGIIGIVEGGEILVKNCLISGNTALSAGGGVSLGYHKFSPKYYPEIRSCTITENSGGYRGGGVCVSGNYYLLIESTIVYNNIAEQEPELGIHWQEGFGGARNARVGVSFSDIKGGLANVTRPDRFDWLGGNIDADPRFIDPNLGDYHLTEASPCVNRGNPDYAADPCEIDIDGQRRVFMGRIDMGADEFAREGPLVWPVPKSFYFHADEARANPADRILTIYNGGIGTLNWQITYDCEWLTIDRDSGSCTYEPNDVVLSVDTTGLSEGQYSCILNIADPRALGGPEEVFVSLAIHGPEIAATPTDFDFSAIRGQTDPPDQKLTIRNEAGGTLNWQIEHDCDWLDVQPAAGTCDFEPNELILSVDTSKVDGGTHNCELSITGNASNSPQIASVVLSVDAPKIVLSRDNLVFSAKEGRPNPPHHTLTVRNGGVGVLEWALDIPPCDWLDIYPDQGTSIGDVNEIVFSADVTGLAPGTYTCPITMYDLNAACNPKTIDVTLDVAGPVIEAVPGEFVFFAEPSDEVPPAQILTIANAGGGTLNWLIDYDCDRISVEPNLGSCVEEMDEVEIAANPAGLENGLYDYQLVISDPNSENSPQTVKVSLVIGPEISLSETEFEFEANIGEPDPTSQILYIGNGSAGTLRWEIDCNCPWLTVVPTSGATAGEPNEVTLSVDVTGLAEGVYPCELTISDPCAWNSPQKVRVELDVSSDCFPRTHWRYDDWVAVGKPLCWCSPYQCDGDADGKTETFFKYRVFGGDLAKIVENWKRRAGDSTFDPCADVDHRAETFSRYRVFGMDLATVIANWKKTDAELPGDCPRD